MNVNLNPVFEDYMKQQLESGMYNNASEVIREALRLKMQKDEVYQARLEALRSAIDDGLQSGDSTDFDMTDILNEARKSVKENA